MLAPGTPDTITRWWYKVFLKYLQPTTPIAGIPRSKKEVIVKKKMSWSHILHCGVCHTGLTAVFAYFLFHLRHCFVHYNGLSFALHVAISIMTIVSFLLFLALIGARKQDQMSDERRLQAFRAERRSDLN
jgi:hypothetical protein